MAFDIDIQHWPTIAAFTAHLQSVPRPSWCRGVTNHNTYIPNETQWHGRASVESCAQLYIKKGWSAGPHLFLAAEAPSAADTGIWQMTPINLPGVHAGACNADHLGIENVGDFNARPPSPAQFTLLLAVNRAILAHWMLTPASVNVHNECMAGRTCPGKYLTGTQIRNALSSAWPPAPKRYRVKRVLISQRTEYGAPWAGELAPGEEITVDKWYSTGLVHLADGRGFVRLADLEAI